MKARDAADQDTYGSHKDVSVDLKVTVLNKTEFYAQISGGRAGAKFPLKTAVDLIFSVSKRCSHYLPCREPQDDGRQSRKMDRVFRFPFPGCESCC